MCRTDKWYVASEFICDSPNGDAHDHRIYSKGQGLLKASLLLKPFTDGLITHASHDGATTVYGLAKILSWDMRCICCRRLVVTEFFDTRG